MTLPAGWLELDHAEEIAIWDRFEALTHFQPSMIPDRWPSIIEPVPSLTWSLAASRSEIEREWRTGMWQWAVDDSSVDHLVMTAIRDCLAESEWLYVLDWQHPTYKCWPHRFDIERAPDEWPVRVFPNGDYYTFVDPDMRNGVFGHPWEATLCLWGRDLIAAVQTRNHNVLTQLYRQDGTPSS